MSNPLHTHDLNPPNPDDLIDQIVAHIEGVGREATDPQGAFGRMFRIHGAVVGCLQNLVRRLPEADINDIEEDRGLLWALYGQHVRQYDFRVEVTCGECGYLVDECGCEGDYDEELEEAGEHICGDDCSVDSTFRAESTGPDEPDVLYVMVGGKPYANPGIEWD